MLLDSLAVERITVEGISINDMLDDYFQKKLPFETRKPNEFKDAILIRSVLLEIERLYKEDFDNKERGKFTWQENIDKLQYLIVSGDKGVSAAFDDEVAVRFNKDVIIFEKITNLLNYIAKQERIVNMLDELLLHNYGINEIEESIRVAVESADIDIECYEGSIEEIDIETVEIEDISTNVISIKELSDGRLVSTVYVYAEVMIYLTVSYIDYDKSFWDKETKSYMWKTIDRKQAQYSTYIDSIIQLDVTDIQDILKDENIDTTTSEGQDELNEWSGKGTVVKDMYDFPNNIYLYEDDMVSSEIIDSRDVYE